jgi:hypothetical protein
MARTLEHPAECDHCGGFLGRGTQADVWFSSLSNTWKAGHVDKRCPPQQEKKAKAVNLPQERDVEDLFTVLVCAKCGTTMSFRRGMRIPARCQQTTYTDNGERCLGEWRNTENSPDDGWAVPRNAVKPDYVDPAEVRRVVAITADVFKSRKVSDDIPF